MNDNEDYLSQLIILSARKEESKSPFSSFLLRLFTEGKLPSISSHLHFIHSLSINNEHYRILLETVIKDNPTLVLKNKLMNLFVKDSGRRSEFYSAMLPLTKEDLGKELVVDPLKSYITLDGKNFREFPWFQPS